ncbi:MAG TPA: hypothetical protein VNE38_16635 [Ktedonobacteraceae bacterium]|nr:hypothetical protein [Ktedonobacteraceae bacterium]
MSTPQVNPTTTLDELLSRWKSDGISNVLFELPDMHGTARSKIVPLNKARGFAEEGLNMFGGAHTHISLVSKANAENAFLDKSDKNGLSDTAYYAGLIASKKRPASTSTTPHIW